MRSSVPFAVLVALVASLCATGAAARANGQEHVDVRGDDVAFYPYSDATTIAANGRVVVRAGNFTLEADAVQYDIGHARIVASGNVVARDRGRVETGAAYVRDLDSGDARILRLEPEPESFAIARDATSIDVARPAESEAFHTLDLDGQRPYIRSRHAIVVPGASVRMSPAAFPTGFGPAFVVPTFLYTLVRNQNLAQSVGPGSSFDQPYNLFGSPNSLTAAHLRYESQDGVTLGIDNRIVDRDRAYVVTSLVPLRGRRADVLAYQQIRPGVQQTLTASHSFGAYALSTAAYRVQATGRSEIATLSTSLESTRLFQANSAELALSTIAHDVGPYGSYQVRGGYGYDHVASGYPFANAFRTFAGANVATPSVALLRTDLGAQYGYDLTAYDYPHEVATGTLTLTGNHDFGRGVSTFGSVSIAQVNNRYRDPAVARRALGLPDARFPIVTPDGTPYLGYFAYAGLSTFRTYRLQTTLRGRGENRVQITLEHDHDFPQYDGYGRPPLTATIDVTRRLTPTIRIEVSRAYTFGWAGRYLSPQYQFGISP